MNRQLKQTACSSRHDRGRVRRHDFRPARDDASRCVVGGRSEPARNAREPIPRGSVALVYRPATRACAARVSGINHHDWDTNQSGFIGQEEPKLVEAPGVVRAALLAGNRCPVSDALKVFKGDAASGVFRLPHEKLADPVVHVTSKTTLLRPPLPEQALGRLAAFGLELRPKPRMARTKVGDVRAAEGLSVAVGGDVLETEIDAEKTARVERFGISDIDHNQKEELSIAVEKIGLSAHPVEPGLLIGSGDPRHDLAPVERQDRDPVRPLPGQNALVVDDGPMRPEARPNGFIPFVDFRHLGDGADGHLGRETKAGAGVSVDELLQLDLVGAAMRVSDFRDGVASRVETFHRPEQRGGLLGRGQKFDLHRQVHAELIAQILNMIKRTDARAAFLRPLKEAASSRVFL